MNKFLILLSFLLAGYLMLGVLFPTDDEIRASRVISDCWDEELKICKDENKGDACSFGVYKLCAANHPEMQKIFEGRLNTCESNHNGTAINDPDILECTGIKTQTPEEFCWEKHAIYEDQQRCIDEFNK